MQKHGKFRILITLIGIMAGIICSVAAFANELPMDRFGLFQKSYDELEVGIPEFPDVEERGIMVKCDEMLIPAMRLELWAKALTPKNEKEHEIAWMKSFSDKASIRYIAVRSLAYEVGLNRTDLGNQISFFDALNSIDSEQFKSLVSLIKTRFKEAKLQKEHVKKSEFQNVHEPVEDEVRDEGVRISRQFREVKFGENSNFMENLEQQSGPNNKRLSEKEKKER